MHEYLKDKIVSTIRESMATKEALIPLAEQIEKAGLLAADRLEKGGRIMFCGNGGSAADAQHIAAELVVRLKGGNERMALPAMSLALDMSTVTAAANDFGFENIFARALEAHGRRGDLLVALSTSGNSTNIIKAMEQAKKQKIAVLVLSGAGGGKMKGQGDMEIIVPSTVTARIQEAHILIGHLLCEIIEKKMFNLD